MPIKIILLSLKKISLKELNKNKKIVLYLSLQKKYNNRLEFQMDYSDNLKNEKV